MAGQVSLFGELASGSSNAYQADNLPEMEE